MNFTAFWSINNNSDLLCVFMLLNDDLCSSIVLQLLGDCHSDDDRRYIPLHVLRSGSYGSLPQETLEREEGEESKLAHLHMLLVVVSDFRP